MNQFKIMYLYTVDDYITFSLRVIWNAFSGESTLCMSRCYIEGKIQELKNLYNKLNGKCCFEDFDSDDFVLFEMKKWGHMLITGQLGGSQNTPFLRYEYYADQTFLNQIILDFENMLTIY